MRFKTSEYESPRTSLDGHTSGDMQQQQAANTQGIRRPGDPAINGDGQGNGDDNDLYDRGPHWSQYVGVLPPPVPIELSPAPMQPPAVQQPPVEGTSTAGSPAVQVPLPSMSGEGAAAAPQGGGTSAVDTYAYGPHWRQYSMEDGGPTPAASVGNVVLSEGSRPGSFQQLQEVTSFSSSAASTPRSASLAARPASTMRRPVRSQSRPASRFSSMSGRPDQQPALPPLPPLPSGADVAGPTATDPTEASMPGAQGQEGASPAAARLGRSSKALSHTGVPTFPGTPDRLSLTIATTTNPDGGEQQAAAAAGGSAASAEAAEGLGYGSGGGQRSMRGGSRPRIGGSVSRAALPQPAGGSGADGGADGAGGSGGGQSPRAPAGRPRVGTSSVSVAPEPMLPPPPQLQPQAAGLPPRQLPLPMFAEPAATAVAPSGSRPDHMPVQHAVTVGAAPPPATAAAARESIGPALTSVPITPPVRTAMAGGGPLPGGRVRRILTDAQAAGGGLLAAARRGLRFGSEPAAGPALQEQAPAAAAAAPPPPQGRRKLGGRRAGAGGDGDDEEGSMRHAWVDGVAAVTPAGRTAAAAAAAGPVAEAYLGEWVSGISGTALCAV